MTGNGMMGCFEHGILSGIGTIRINAKRRIIFMTNFQR